MVWLPVPRRAPHVCDHRGVHTILIADDHPSFRACARSCAEEEGWRVVGETSDGASTLAEVERLRPDIVLLDVQLPDMSGFEVASRLTGNGGGPVVVLISSRDSADYGELIERSGARGFIPKADLTGAAVAALVD